MLMDVLPHQRIRRPSTCRRSDPGPAAWTTPRGRRSVTPEPLAPSRVVRALYNPDHAPRLWPAEGFRAWPVFRRAFNHRCALDGDEQRGVVQFESDADTPIRPDTCPPSRSHAVPIDQRPGDPEKWAEMRFQLRCSNRRRVEWRRTGRFRRTVQSVLYTPEWSSNRLEMSNFGPAAMAAGVPAGRTSACSACRSTISARPRPRGAGRPDLGGVLSIDTCAAMTEWRIHRSHGSRRWSRGRLPGGLRRRRVRHRLSYTRFADMEARRPHRVRPRRRGRQPGLVHRDGSDAIDSDSRLPGSCYPTAGLTPLCPSRMKPCRTLT